ncbi:50S ribosomal protein L11 methyltransferase, partial [Salmonella enterica]|uniref:50S ribosomal protein L11 methyltransferase n=1 Tax=Salmonella enterica TaxID=28901 RepID=UPI00398C3B06
MEEGVEGMEAATVLGSGIAHKIETREDIGWERDWIDTFHPMRFGERLWICPSWREMPDENAVNVMRDPGLAFGTGTHPTTSLCPQWQDGLGLTGKICSHSGCGAGILAMTAWTLGAPKPSSVHSVPAPLHSHR